MIRTDKRVGFTIVELLIVIVVIGILAAITIVAFNGVQKKARDTAIHSDIRNAGSKLALFTQDNGHPPQDAAELNSVNLKFKPSQFGTAIYCADEENFGIGGRRPDSVGPGFIYSSVTGTAKADGVGGSIVTTCERMGITTATYRIWISPPTTNGWDVWAS